jgi:hypothetical protein
MCLSGPAWSCEQSQIESCNVQRTIHLFPPLSERAPVLWLCGAWVGCPPPPRPALPRLPSPDYGLLRYSRRRAGAFIDLLKSKKSLREKNGVRVRRQRVVCRS